MAIPKSASTTATNWSLTISRLFIGAAVLLTTLYLGRLTGTIDDQKDERNCRFDLTTETDRLDSDIAVTQARIFEAAILRPNPGGGPTDEMRDLGRQLHDLISNRDEAYTRRAQASARCDQ